MKINKMVRQTTALICVFAGWVQGVENDQIVTLPNGNKVQIVYDGNLHDEKTRENLPYSVSAEFYKDGSSLSVHKQKIVINLPEIRKSSQLFLGDFLDLCLHGHCTTQIVFPYFYLGQCRDVCEGIVLLNHFAERREKYSQAAYSKSLTPGMRNNFEEACRRFADEEGKVNIPLLFLFHHELRQSMTDGNFLKIDEDQKISGNPVSQELLTQSYQNARTKLNKLEHLAEQWVSAQKTLSSNLKRVTDQSSAQQAVAGVFEYRQSRRELVENINMVLPDDGISASYTIIASLMPNEESVLQSLHQEMNRIDKESYFGCKDLFYMIRGKRDSK